VPSDDAVDELYALPLDEFVRGRNALVKELKAAGDKDAAAAVAALRRPSAPAWVVNQLARASADRLEAFLEAGAKVAEAQAGALRGAGSAPLREAAAAERAALRDVLAAAKPLARNEALLTRVGSVLRAAVADPAVAEQVRAGRLSDEPEASALAGLGGLDTAAGATASGGDATQAEPDLEAERREARRHAIELARRAEKAEREAARLEARAETAEREARERRQSADLAREEADELRRAADEAAAAAEAE
jgi:hypothetical protein